MVGSDLVCGTRSILRGRFTSFLILRQLEVDTEPCLGTGPGLVVVHKNTLEFGFGCWICPVAGRSLGERLMLSSHKVDGARTVKGSSITAVFRCWKRKGQTFGMWKCQKSQKLRFKKLTLMSFQLLHWVVWPCLFKNKFPWKRNIVKVEAKGTLFQFGKSISGLQPRPQWIIPLHLWNANFFSSSENSHTF